MNQNGKPIVLKSLSDLSTVDSRQENPYLAELSSRVEQPFFPSGLVDPTTSLCKHCKRNGKNSLRIDGVCEDCYILLRVEPLKRQQRQLEESLSIINNSLYSVLSKLGVERKIQLSGKTVVLTCHKCGVYKTTIGIHMVWHEEQCAAIPNSTRAASHKAKKVVGIASAPSLEDFND